MLEAVFSTASPLEAAFSTGHSQHLEAGPHFEADSSLHLGFEQLLESGFLHQLILEVDFQHLEADFERIWQLEAAFHSEVELHQQMEADFYQQLEAEQLGFELLHSLILAVDLATDLIFGDLGLIDLSWFGS